MRENRWVRTALCGRSERDGKGKSLSEWAIWAVVTAAAKGIGLESFGAHDLRWSCAKLCRAAGRDLEQIKFLLGHSSIRTTERYLGSEQDIAVAVNDSLRLWSHISTNCTPDRLALVSDGIFYRLYGHALWLCLPFSAGEFTSANKLCKRLIVGFRRNLPRRAFPFSR